MKGGANLPLVGSYNRNLVLETLRAHGELSRVELAAMTGLTGPAVSRIVRLLMDNGLLVETGRGESTGGRPRTLLQLEPHGRFAVGAQVAAATTTLVLTDLLGTIVQRATLDHGCHSDRDSLVPAVVQGVLELLDTADVPRERVTGLGVAFPGLVDSETGTIRGQGSLPDWADVMIGPPLASGTGLTVVVDNDATAATLGERWTGAAGSVSSFAVVYAADGIGSGLFLDGRVYRGASSMAGELAHVVVEPDGLPCFCGKSGCLTGYASPHSTVRAAQRHQSDHRGCRLGVSEGQATISSDYALLVQAHAVGDPCAAALVERSTRALQAAVSNLVELLDLELVVLAGDGYGQLAEQHLEALRAAVDARAESARTEVALSPIAEAAAAVGAAALVLHREFGARMVGLMSAQ